MVGAKPFQQAIEGRVIDENLAWSKASRSVPFLLEALKCFVLVPIAPLVGFYLLDQTGFSHWLIVQGFIPKQILGEGFGHVGLCFSIHYVFTGVRELFRAVRLILSQG